MIGAEPFLTAPSTRPATPATLQRALASSDPVDESRQGLVALAHHGVVDPRKRADVLRPHLAVEVRPAEDDHDLRPLLLDLPREREGGDVLLEARGEADDPIHAPVDCAGPAGDQLRELLVAHPAELVELHLELFEGLLHARMRLAVLLLVLPRPERRSREEPLAQKVIPAELGRACDRSPPRAPPRARG